MAITVKVAHVPGRSAEVVLGEGSTVADALEYAEETVGENEQIQLNGKTASTSETVKDGDMVLINKGAKNS